MSNESDSPTTTEKRVSNYALGERLVLLELQQNTFAKNLADLAANTKEGMENLSRIQRSNQENLEKAIHQSHESLAQTINSKTKGQDDNKKFTIQTGIAVLGLVAGGLMTWGVSTVRSYVDSYGIPLRADISRLDSTVSRNAQDLFNASGILASLNQKATASEVDRGDKGRDIAELKSEYNNQAHELAVLKTSVGEKLKEVETQFRAQSQVLNLTRAHNSQMTGLLWAKVFEQTLPPINYFPDISQNKPLGQ